MTLSDSPITGSGRTIKSVFSGRRYQLDHYQRDYSWGREEVRRLVEDLHRRFALNYRFDHDRHNAASYQPYFLGSFVYHEDAGVSYVVDGQQRITTLHVLLIFLRRLLVDLGLNDDVANLEPLIRTSDYGQVTFTINIPDRAELLEHLFEDDYAPAATSDAALRRLWDAADELDTVFPQDLRGEALPYFVDWLLNRVCMVGIKALDRDQGWEIYESVNDRGVRLGPLDLLKSFLLRHMTRETDGMDVQWRNMVSRLAAVEPNAPVRFIKAFFVGRHARTADDMMAIEENFFAWFRDHAEALDLARPGDFRALVGEMAKYAEHFATLAAATSHFDEDLRHLFYNRYNRQSEQFSPILAAIDIKDDAIPMKAKAAKVAAYLDLVFVWRFISGQPTAEGELAAIARELVLDLRPAHDLNAVGDVLAAHVSRLEYAFLNMHTFGLQGNNKRQIRYILARLTAYVAVGCGRSDECARYLADEEPYEIEHVWANKFERYQSTTVNSRQVFDAVRNRLGALVLLAKSDNASYRDSPYDIKIDFYQRQNDLAASLHPRHRKNNPQFNKFVGRIQLDKEFRGYPTFDEKTIALRQELYKRLCERVWDPEFFGVKAKSFPINTDPAVRRTRARFDVALTTLMDAGLLVAGTTLIGHRRKERYSAQLLPDGSVEVSTGEVFGSLSAAGQFVLGTKSCQGWMFWKIVKDGQEVALADIRRAALVSGDLEDVPGTTRA